MAIHMDDTLEEIEVLTAELKEEQNIISVEEDVDLLLQQKNGLDIHSTIATSSLESNTLTKHTVAMLTASLEASAHSLGVDIDNIVILPDTTSMEDREALTITLEAKESMVKKIIFAIKKVVAKISLYLRKMLSKILTTLSNSTSVLKKLTKELDEIKDGDKVIPYSGDEGRPVVRRFATVASLNLVKDKFNFKGLNGAVSAFKDDPISSDLISALAKFKETDFEDKNFKNVTDELKRLEVRGAGYKEFNRILEKSVDNFNFSKEDAMTVKKLRWDQIGIVDTTNDKIKFYIRNDEMVKIITAKLTKEYVEKLRLTEVPTVSLLRDYVESATRINDDLPKFIDRIYKEEKENLRAFELINKAFGSFGLDQKGHDLMKKYVLLSPRVMTGEVMFRFKTIRNVIALARHTIEARK